MLTGWSLLGLLRPSAGDQAVAESAPQGGEEVRLEWTAGDESAESQEGLVELSESWGLTVVAPCAIARRTAVRVRQGAAVYPAEVLSCQAGHGDFELELAFLGAGRRRTDRLDAGGEATLMIGSAGSWRTVAGAVQNVSDDGLQFSCEESLSVGATCRVVGSQTERIGLIRYCESVGSGCRVGVQFVGAETWGGAQRNE